jgi:hypothetical protein
VLTMDGRRMAWVCVELATLWVAGPILLWNVSPLAGYHIHALVLATGYAAVVAIADGASWAALGFRGARGLIGSLRAGGPWVAGALAVLALGGWAFQELAGTAWSDRLPWPLLARIAFFYPAVSVTGQEFLYSSFFFWRYRPLFSPGFLVVLNALFFGFAHLVYGSWISVALAFAGRVLLAHVYRRHESFWGVWILHAVLGLAAITLGLGRYFYRPVGW